jgi:predicted ester cyclase
MITRRRFIDRVLGTAAGLGIARGTTMAHAQTTNAQLERNKATVVRLKKSQGTPQQKAIEAEILAPDFKRLRGGMLNLAANAEGQGFPSSGINLRGAFPDRVDVIEEIIAEDDRVGLLFRLTGTHLGNFFGIEPTGKKVDVYEAGIYRLANDKVVEAWFMADELGALLQLGATLPSRKDAKRIAPPITDAGEDGDAVLARLLAKPIATLEDRNKIIVARSKSSQPNPGDRSPDYKQRRLGLQHLRNYGHAHGTAEFTPTRAFPGRNDRITGMIAEGEKVWMMFNLRGTHKASFYGLPATGHRVEMPEIGIMRVVDGKWMDGWYFGDELGILLQLGALHMVKQA